MYVRLRFSGIKLTQKNIAKITDTFKGYLRRINKRSSSISLPLTNYEVICVIYQHVEKSNHFQHN